MSVFSQLANGVSSFSFRSGSPGPRYRAFSIIKSVLVLLICLGGVGIYAAVMGKHYPLNDWLVWRLGLVWAYTLAFNLACVAFGSFLCERVFRLTDRPLAESLLFSMGTGLVSFAFVMFLGGAAGLFHSGFALALPAAMIAVGALSLGRLVRRCVIEARAESPTVFERNMSVACAMIGAPLIALLYLQCMTPDAINFDASWYHIPVAQDYARAGRIVPFFSDYNRAFPQLMSIVFTWGYLVPGLITPLKWMMPLHLEFSMVTWKIVGVAVAARWMLGGERSRGLWVAFFLFPSVFVYDQNPGGSADHFLGFFALPMLLALAYAIEAFDLRKCALFGVLAGGAMLTKYQAVYMLGASGVILGIRFLYVVVKQLRARKNHETVEIPFRTLLLAPLVIVGTWLLAVSPHFVKNAVYYHNPIYPLGQNIFTNTYPIHEKAYYNFKHAYPNHPWEPPHGLLNRAINSLKLFFTFSFAPHYSFTKNVPVIGSLFTLMFPAVLFVAKPKRIWFGIAVAFFAIVVWTNTYIVDRYLQAIIPLFAAIVAALVVRIWQLGKIARAGLVPLLLFQVIWSGDAFFYSGNKRLESAVNLIRSGFEGKRSDADRFNYRKSHLDITAATPKDARILVRNYRTTLGIDREVLSDVQAWQNLFFYEPLKSPRELYELYKSRGVTHILHPPGQPPFDTVQASVLFADLIANTAKQKKRFGSLELIEMPKEAPPIHDSYNVIVVTVEGYRDGLYPVEALTYYQRLPKEMRTRPAPAQAIKATKETLEGLRQSAAAVVVGDRSKTLVKGAIGTEFSQASSYKGFTVFVRNQGSAKASPASEPAKFDAVDEPMPFDPRTDAEEP